MTTFENIAAVITQRADSLFPFCDTAPLTTTQNIAFPHNILTDFRCVVCGDAVQVFLADLTFVGSHATFRFTDRTEQVRLIADVDINGPADAAIEVRDRQELPTGFLVVNTQLLQSWRMQHASPDRFVFPGERNLLLPTCLHFYPYHGVRFLLPDGQLVTGPVVLVGENGVVLRYGRVIDPASANYLTPDAADVLRIDFTGDPLPGDETCDRIDELTPRIFLEDFGGATRDSQGNVQLRAQRLEHGTALKVDTDPVNQTIRLYLAGVT